MYASEPFNSVDLLFCEQDYELQSNTKGGINLMKLLL